MPSHYDNWERLVAAVLRKVHDRQLVLLDSCSVSSASSSSLSNLSFNDERPFCELLMDYSDLALDHNMWKPMLPTGQDQLVWSSSAPLSFFLDTKTGKNCFLLGATKSFDSVNTPSKDWTRISYYKESRFMEVASISYPAKLDLKCQINTKILSPGTRYAAYLVYSCGYIREGLYSYEDSSTWRFLDVGADRADGWREIELGGFGVHGTNHDLIIHLQEDSRQTNKSIDIGGIGFRPYTKDVRKLATSTTNTMSFVSGVVNLSYRTGNQPELVQRQNIQIPIGVPEQTMNHEEWKSMIPLDNRQAIWRSDSLNFFLDQETAKNCFFIGCAYLVFSSGNWEILSWDYAHISRFRRMGRLENSEQYNIEGEINAQILSPNTHYSAYLVLGSPSDKIFGSTSDKINPAKSEIVFHGSVRGLVDFKTGKGRADKWVEVELGQFYVGNEVDGTVKVSMWDTGPDTKHDLLIDGIEFRPNS